tara:strand:- start:295 stop:399 length:105 start_codon:yes stop_codon:yes gene_type:complete
MKSIQLEVGFLSRYAHREVCPSFPPLAIKKGWTK